MAMPTTINIKVSRSVEDSASSQLHNNILYAKRTIISSPVKRVGASTEMPISSARKAGTTNHEVEAITAEATNLLTTLSNLAIDSCFVDVALNAGDSFKHDADRVETRARERLPCSAAGTPEGRSMEGS
jgi:hypothetical protein